MGGTSRLEILQLLMAGTVEEQLHADLQRERAEPAAAEARERRRGAGEDGGTEHAEGMQARLLNALKLVTDLLSAVRRDSFAPSEQGYLAANFHEYALCCAFDGHSGCYERLLLGGAVCSPADALATGNGTAVVRPTTNHGQVALMRRVEELLLLLF